MKSWAKDRHITGVGEDVRAGVMAVEVDLVLKNSLHRQKMHFFLFEFMSKSKSSIRAREEHV